MRKSSTTNHDHYIPGTCNIGADEIIRRQRSGWISLAAAIVLWSAFIWLNVDPVWRLALFIPATLAATGFLQAYMHFCTYFGFASLLNFGGVGRTDSVVQAEYRRQDRRKAWQIVAYAVVMGVVVAYLGYVS